MALLNPKTKQFKSADQIQAIYNKHGITRNKTVYVMCVSECFGSSIYLAARVLGYENIALYDGSWIEWAEKQYPIEANSGAIFTPVKQVIKTEAEEAYEGC